QRTAIRPTTEPRTRIEATNAHSVPAAPLSFFQNVRTRRSSMTQTSFPGGWLLTPSSNRTSRAALAAQSYSYVGIGINSCPDRRLRHGIFRAFCCGRDRAVNVDG